MLAALERQRNDLWHRFLITPVADLYLIQAEAWVITRMENEARDKIASSLNKKR